MMNVGFLIVLSREGRGLGSLRRNIARGDGEFGKEQYLYLPK